MTFRVSLAGADALRRHCHHIVNTLGPATPPEPFLFRGHAYFALGMPFFALADYRIAGELAQISPEYEERCHKAIEKFPAHQVGVFPAADSHLHIHVDPFLENAQIKSVDDKMGRGLFASKDLAPHEIVLKPSEPWVRYPTDDGLCSFCATPLPDRCFPCGNSSCHEEYCSRDCRTKAELTYHTRVCRNFEFQSVELDLFSQLKRAQTQSERNAAASHLLALRIMAIAIQNQIAPNALSEIRILSGRMQYSPATLGGTMLSLYERLTRACRITTSFSYEEFVALTARVVSNCFTLENYIELNLPRSFFNHSCEGNVAENPSTQEMITTSSVRSGDELTINYYPHLKNLPFAERKHELELRGFKCLCQKCRSHK